MEQIYLEEKHAAKLQMFLLMTTKFREDELATWEKLANERNSDGTVKFPYAKDNADFWKETIYMISEVMKAIDRRQAV
ncbi:MAG: hypothetical protein RR394_10060 [Oscillospiraceae bacterium]